VLLTIVSLSHGWTAGKNVGLTVTGNPDDHLRRRAHVVTAVRAASTAMLLHADAISLSEN